MPRVVRTSDGPITIWSAAEWAERHPDGGNTLDDDVERLRRVLGPPDEHDD
jgi:hypothetical protein